MSNPIVWYFRKDRPEDYEVQKFAEAANELGIDMRVVHPNHFDIMVTRYDRKSIRYNGENIGLPDLVLSRTGSGTDYYAFSVLYHLEKMQVRVINEAAVVETVKDKLSSIQLLNHAGVPVPKTMLVKFPVDVEIVEKQIGIPCVVKVLTGSNGEGITLIKSKDALKELMEFVTSLKGAMNIIIQEYISCRPGEDIRVITAGKSIIGAMKRKSTDGDFRANIGRGGSSEKIELNQGIIEIALTAAGVCGLEIGGIDLLFDGESYRVCECNSAPGFIGFDSAHKISTAHKILEYIKDRYF